MWTISLYLKYDHLWRILENQPGFPSGTSGKEHTCQCRRRDMGLIPGSGRSPGGEHGNPLQYSCLKNLMDRGTWWATIHRVTKSRTRLKQLSTHACGKPTIILKTSKGKDQVFILYELHWNSQNTGVGSLSLLQEIFPTQGLNPGLLNCKWTLDQLSHREAQEYWSG